MITKIGYALTKTAGISRSEALAADLTEEQKNILRQEYGLSPSENLILRSSSREDKGALLGALPGIATIIGGTLTGHHGIGVVGAPLAFIGGMVGRRLAGNRYTRENAERIKMQRALNVPHEEPA